MRMAAPLQDEIATPGRVKGAQPSTVGLTLIMVALCLAVFLTGMVSRKSLMVYLIPI